MRVFVKIIKLSLLLLVCNSCFDKEWEDIENGSYPSYLEVDYRQICRTLDEYVRDSCTLVGFITDLHYSSNGSGFYETKLRKGVFNALHVLKDLNDKYDFSIVVMGGDYVQLPTPSSGKQTYEQGVECVRDAVSFSQLFRAPTFLLRGNHEVNYSGGSEGYGMTAEDFYRYSTSHSSDDFVLDGTNNWAYMDDPSSCIRYVFMDVVGMNYKQDQYRWLQETVLKGVPTGYSLMFFSHVPLSDMGEWKGNRSYADLLESAEKSGHDVIACVSGHIHSDWHHFENGILYVTTLQAGYLTPKMSEDGVMYEHKKNSSEESAFDVIAIDKKHHKIHFVRFGLGKSRDYDY